MNIKNFIAESIAELKKVQWPSKDEVVSSTIIVLVSLIVFAVILGFTDIVFQKLVDWVIR